jgi:hypothetical protein
VITFFTTTKDFRGRAAVQQVNAIRSWRASASRAEVVVFGECEGVKEARERLGFAHVPEVETSDQGTPYINDMFDRIGRIAAHDICCYVNSDILLSPRFAKSLAAIHGMARAGYLVAGQRLDLDLEQEIRVGPGWETDLEALCFLSGRIHPPTGSDFFAFPKGQYRKEDMPALLVGRGGWDLWMIADGRRRKLKVIDLSQEVLVVHQNHDYSHRKVAFTGYPGDGEALWNVEFLPRGDKQDLTLYACDRYFREGKIRRNFARGDWKRFLTIEMNLRKGNPLCSLMSKIFFRLGLIY